MIRRSHFALLTLIIAFAANLSAQSGLPRKKVMIIGVDGCRPDALMMAATPNIDALVQEGSSSMSAMADFVTLSGTSWSSILTGVWRSKHGVNNNNFTGTNLASYPNLFARVKQSCPSTRVASIARWGNLNANLNQNADIIRTESSDQRVLSETIELLRNDDPDLFFLHMDNVDVAGHIFGFTPIHPIYLLAINILDGYVGQLRSAIENRPTYDQEDWLIVMITDHGGLLGTHGGMSPDERTTFLIVSGDAADQGATISPSPGSVDLVPTVLDFLNIPVNPSWGLDGLSVGLAPTAPTPTPTCVECPRAFQVRSDHLNRSVSMSWVPGNDPGISGFDVLRDGNVIASLPAGSASFVDILPPGYAQGHRQIRYEIVATGAAGGDCVRLVRDAYLSFGDIRFADDFDDYIDDLALQAAGWAIFDEGGATEPSTWTLSNPGGRVQPPGVDGSPGRGQFIASDSEASASLATLNTPGTGMSHDLWSPPIDCTGLDQVWLHADCSAQLDITACSAIFAVDVMEANGSWTRLLTRVSPGRPVPLLPTTNNAGGFFGRLDIDLSAQAAGRSGVRFRLRHFEPTWDLWVAIDNVIVDDQDLTSGGCLELLPLEDFGLGIPASYSQVGLKSGSASWTGSDPCSRSTSAAGGVFPHQGGRGVNRLGSAFAIMDSSCSAGGEDELLVTPSIDCSLADRVWIHYRSEALITPSTRAELLLSLDGGQTFQSKPIFAYSAGGLMSARDPVYAERCFEVPAAAGERSVSFAFRFQSPGGQWWWAIDDVRVSADPAVVASSTDIGGSCSAQNPAPTLSTSLPQLGTTLSFALENAPPGIGFVLASPSPTLPATAGMPCTLQLDPAVQTWIIAPISVDPAGRWFHGVALPAIPALAGFTAVMQCGFAPTGSVLGYDLSNAVRLVFGC